MALKKLIIIVSLAAVTIAATSCTVYQCPTYTKAVKQSEKRIDHELKAAI